MIRIAICDDDNEVCRELENIILHYQNQTGENLDIDIFYSGENLIYNVKNEQRYDLIFLDIELEKINGVEVGKVIRYELEDYITKIAYVSSKNSYDRELLDLQPLSFLSKPIERTKVIRVIKLAMKIMEKENKLFSFKAGQEIYKIPIKEIIYFESLGRKVKMVTTKETLYFYDTMDFVSKQLSKSRFMRTHRSYLVNYDNITSIRKDEVKACNGDIIPLSKSKYTEVKELQILYEEEGC